jgi:xanthine/CO dehydrogenase XdhC/CoxF family maturation factor
MNELQRVVDALSTDDGESVLATVVATEGSVYRRPGARMLVISDGRSIGSISGGCLEADVLERALRLAPGECAVVTYDTQSRTDVVWGLGLGCDGVVTVLVERPCRRPAYFDFVARGETGVLATVFRGDDRTDAGARLTLVDGGVTPHGRWDEDLVARVVGRAREVCETGRSRTIDLDGVSIFLELVEPPERLVVFGAGQDAVPLVRLASQLGRSVTVVDWRPAFAVPERFPEADAVVRARPEAAGGRVRVDEHTSVVLVTHNYLADRELLEWLAGTPARYIGLLGPRRRAERLLADIGDVPASALRGRLYAPAGLDVGADTPDEIALAIVAEIQAVRTGRRGGSLRERAGAIHDDPIALAVGKPV